jgi:PKD repeat protein
MQVSEILRDQLLDSLSEPFFKPIYLPEEEPETGASPSWIKILFFPWTALEKDKFRKLLSICTKTFFSEFGATPDEIIREVNFTFSQIEMGYFYLRINPPALSKKILEFLEANDDWIKENNIPSEATVNPQINVWHGNYLSRVQERAKEKIVFTELGEVVQCLDNQLEDDFRYIAFPWSFGWHSFRSENENCPACNLVRYLIEDKDVKVVISTGKFGEEDEDDIGSDATLACPALSAFQEENKDKIILVGNSNEEQTKVDLKGRKTDKIKGPNIFCSQFSASPDSRMGYAGVWETAVFLNKNLGGEDSFIPLEYCDPAKCICRGKARYFDFKPCGLQTIKRSILDGDVIHNELVRLGVRSASYPPPPAREAPVGADFGVSNTGPSIGEEITFTNRSTGAIESNEWDFGDKHTSGDTNPTHVYGEADTYTVSLTISGPMGTDTAIQTVIVQGNPHPPPPAREAPVGADFGVSNPGPSIGEEITFTNRSTGAIESNEWDFGDKHTSGDTNPTHAYGEAGTYAVSLTISGPMGTNTATQTVIVQVDIVGIYWEKIVEMIIDRIPEGQKIISRYEAIKIARKTGLLE